MKSIEKVIRVAGFLAAVSLVVLVLLVAYDALARYLFSSGSIALQELEWHLFDVVIMLSIAYTLQMNAHVRVDIFYEHFSTKRKAFVNLLAQLIFITPFSFLVIYVGFEFVTLSFSQMEGSSNPGGLPYRFIVKSLMPLSFALLFLQSIKDIMRAVHTIKAIK
ncbi:MAG: TRAP transporter small permease subunit [Campylobacterota bacterium]|nr:TRAP transporter small permease subunit [Campylobacterota bacterium]